MLTQLIKIIWQRRGNNFLLLIEVIFSFLVLFATLTMAINQFRNYYTPTGFDFKDVHVFTIDSHGEEGNSYKDKVNQIKNHLRTMPEIASHALSDSNVPYGNSTNSAEFFFEGRSVVSGYYSVEPEYFETMDLELASGKFFEKGNDGKVPSVVINEAFVAAAFKEENPLGKMLTDFEGKPEAKVVGVVKYFRLSGEFSKSFPALFYPVNVQDSSAFIPNTIVIEKKAGAGNGWPQALLDEAILIAPNWAFEEEAMGDMRAIKAKQVTMPIITIGLIGGFLIFNVGLGLFGVLWMNISKRFSEIGIRRVVGATRGSIKSQVVGEVLVLATFGILLGLLLAMQFPLLGVFNVEATIYAVAILASMFLIYLLVALCAWYPSRQASKIEPAEALHYE